MTAPCALLRRGFDLSRAPFGYAPAGASSSEGLLVVNHEQFDPRFLHGGAWKQRTDEQKLRERNEIGVSVSRVAHRDGRWQLVPDRNAVILREQKPIGVITRTHLVSQMSGPYGYSRQHERALNR